MSTGNKAVPELPPIPDPLGGALYIAKDNTDYHVACGGAGGVATLGSDGLLVASQRPPNPYGFTPVQQGTGVGQNAANVVKIGWSGTRLKGTIDTTDLGNFVFDTQLAAYVPTSRTITSGVGLTGGTQNLSGNITLAVGTPSTVGNGSTNSVSGTTHSHAVSLVASDIPALDTSKVTTGVFASARLAGSYTNLVNTTGSGDSTFTNFLASSLGTAAAPAFAFSTDTNTGIWSSGADTLDIATGGVNRIVVNSSGLTVTGAISATGNITAYSSDARLKKNVQNIQAPMDKLFKIGGYTFDWDGPKCFIAGFHPDHEHEHGVLAQEVARVMPDAVSRAAFDPEYLTVNYARLVPLLIECIKDLQNQIDELKDK
jgi:hypothetical protein